MEPTIDVEDEQPLARNSSPVLQQSGITVVSRMSVLVSRTTPPRKTGVRRRRRRY